MRVRSILGGTRGAPGGTERVAAVLEGLLQRRGWDCEWLSPADLSFIRTSSRFPGLNEWFRAQAVARELRRLPPVDLHCSHGMYGAGARGKRLHVYHGTFAGLVTACRAGMHRLDYLVGRYLNGGAEQRSGQGARRVAVSRLVAEEVRRYYRHTVACTIGNGADPEELREIPQNAARIQLGLPEEGRLVLMVGRMDYGKGREVLRRVLPILPAGVRVVLAAPSGSGLESLPAEQVIRIPGVPRDQLSVLYSAGDVLLSTSLYEGFGLTPIEAWLCGRPVVSARTGVMAELAEAPELGPFVTPVEDATAAAKAVNRLLEDREAAQLQVEWGRETAHRRFSPQAMAAGYLAEVDALLQGDAG